MALNVLIHGFQLLHIRLSSQYNTVYLTNLLLRDIYVSSELLIINRLIRR